MDKEIRQLEDELKDLLYQLESAMEKEFQTAQIEEMTGVDMEQLEREFEVSIKETLAYEKVHPEAKDPQYAYESDSGFDLCSTEDIIIEGLGRALAPTGLKFDIPKGFDETIGAVPLGFLLCLLTLMAGNIWIAFLVHVAMAWTNSLTALKHHPEIHYNKWQKNAS
jgi:hypothetical protein